MDVQILSEEDVRQIAMEVFRQLHEADSGALLNVDGAAEFLQCSRQTVWALRRRGDIPAVEISPGCYRFRPSDLKAWIANRTGRARTPRQKAAAIMEGAE
ncbi:MAG TPA: helix-turn-helix domain-containing protein [bacterium]|nr:helix-turn-helix domain-containing protein [bacterium]